MAATIVSSRVVQAGAASLFLTEIKLSGLTAGLAETLSHLGPTGCTPSAVRCEMTAQPTDGSVVSFTHTATSTTNDTITVRFDVPAGGTMDGATATVMPQFTAMATGGLSTITTT